MYISDLTLIIRNFRDGTEPMTEEIYNFFDFILDEIEQVAREAVRWSVDDFIGQANQRSNPEDYDPEKFQDALEMMIDKHDPTIGITWDTIDYYLDEYCRAESIRYKSGLIHKTIK